ncbi:MAG: hypothetical protein AB7F41_01220 [Methylocystis sp.]|uniref:hypothetical protein n=1 Tax=Methylocystis sp. TaxID=1911079 RepID=UPI003D100E56
MKDFLSGIVSLRRRRRIGFHPAATDHRRNRSVASIALSLFLAGAGPTGFARAEQPAKAAPIERAGVLILVRSSLLALDQANKTGVYTVLRDLGSPQFQTNTAARLAEIFAGQRRDKFDLSAVAAIDPQLTTPPAIDAKGMLRLVGFFPAGAQQLNFDLTFAPVDGQWRLFGISAGLGQSTQPTTPAKKPPPKTRSAPKKQGTE